MKISLKSIFSSLSGKQRSNGFVSNVFIIAGLGNPGRTYHNSRHNIGFWMIDIIREAWKVEKKKKNKFDAEIYEMRLKDRILFLVKPMTYMNRSGICIQKITSFYKIIPSSNLIVILDDLDLPPAKLRIRTSGSSGGHKGLSSIISELGTENFIRLRIGIGRPTCNAETYVLSKIPDEEMQLFEKVSSDCLKALELILDGKVTEAMNNYNRGA